MPLIPVFVSSHFVSARRLKEAVGKQIGESDEGFPARGGAGKSVVETGIQHKVFACGVANGPQIPYGIAPQEGLRKMPDLAGEREFPLQRVRNREALAELAPADAAFVEFVEHGIRVVVKSLHIRAGQEHHGISGAAEIKFGCATVVDAVEVADRKRRLGTFARADDGLRPQEYFGYAVCALPRHTGVNDGFAGREKFQPGVNGKFHYLVRREARGKFGRVARAGEARFKLQIAFRRKRGGSGNGGTAWVCFRCFTDRRLRAGFNDQKSERDQCDWKPIHLILDAVAK